VRTVDTPLEVSPAGEVFTDGAFKAGKSAASIAAMATYCGLVDGTPANCIYRGPGLHIETHLPQSSYTGEAFGILLRGCRSLRWSLIRRL
jgi:hypothetical protein